MQKLLVLQPADGSKPTKTIRKDGSKISFDQRQKFWKFHWLEYNNFHSIIEELILADHSTFVLGAPTQYALDNIDDPLPRIKRAKPEFPNPTIKEYRDGEQLVLDLDDVYWPMFDSANPEPAIREYLKENGINCDVTWQITSGQKPGSREARVRLYMVGERDYPLEYRKAWCLRCGADSAVYTANQVIYTASPIYEDGKDPIKKRVGFIEGKHRKLKLPLVDMNEVAKVIEENTYTAAHFETDELPPEVKSGKVFRRYFMPKAFSLLNKGLTHNQVFTIIQAEASQVEGREFNAENTHDYIKDAESKIDEERKAQRLAQQHMLEGQDETKKHYSSIEIPDEVLFPPGSNIEELAMALYKNSYRPNKMICAMTTRALIAFMAGGKYKSVQGDRLNIQQVITAGTAVGKNVGVNAFNQHATKLLGPDNLDLSIMLRQKIVNSALSSTQGIMDSAKDGHHHDMLFNIDEYGKFIEEATGKNADKNKAAYYNMFLEIYSASNGTYIPSHLSKANDQKPRILHAPCFILNAATTQATFIDGVSSDDLVSGRIGRLCVFDADRYAHRPVDPEPFEISEDLQNHLAKLSDTKVLEQNMVLIDKDLISQARVDTPIMIDFGDGVAERVRELRDRYYDKYEQQSFGVIWTRAIENIKKYACIEAVAEDYMNPVVTVDMLERARLLVEASCKYMVAMFDEEVSENQYDGAEKSVIERLFKEGEGNWVPQKVLKELNKIKKLGSPRQKQEILDGLENDAVIVKQETPNTRGKPTVLYRLSDMYFVVMERKKQRRS
jgi:hypothetical protein